MNTKQKIIDFIISNFPKARELKTFDDISLLDEGIIDSVGVLELILFLEQTFAINVDDDEIIPDNLDSVNKLVIYVRSKLKK